jgi:Asp-tRNA(Asn)/Glu-tRNA(Gln) amidotransferase C subunit
MATVQDLERLAHLAGLSASAEELEGLAPLLETLFADLDRLMALPIHDLAPAFAPVLSAGTPSEAAVQE